MVLFKSTERTAKHIVTHRLEDAVDSVAVEADVTLRALPGADAGAFSALVCVASPPEEPVRGYAFFVWANEAGGRGFAIVEVDETDESLRQVGFLRYLVDEGSDAAAGVGGTNHVRGECRTTGQEVELAMFLNGSQVGTATDRNGLHPFDGLAFLVLSQNAGTEVRYDNFSAEDLGEVDSD
jgi:hypothetical protein